MYVDEVVIQKIIDDSNFPAIVLSTYVFILYKEEVNQKDIVTTFVTNFFYSDYALKFLQKIGVLDQNNCLTKRI